MKTKININGLDTKVDIKRKDGKKVDSNIVENDVTYLISTIPLEIDKRINSGINLYRKLRILSELHTRFIDEDFCNKVFTQKRNRYLCVLLFKIFENEKNGKIMCGSFSEYHENADLEYISVKKDIYEKLTKLNRPNFLDDEYRLGFLRTMILNIKEKIKWL